jgi:hypothetical protein
MLSDRVLPETLRTIVGDGSVVPPVLYRPPIPLIKSLLPADNSTRPAKGPLQNPLLLFTYPDIVTLLIFNGLVYAGSLNLMIVISPYI